MADKINTAIVTQCMQDLPCILKKFNFTVWHIQYLDMQFIIILQTTYMKYVIQTDGCCALFYTKNNKQKYYCIDTHKYFKSCFSSTLQQQLFYIVGYFMHLVN